MASPAPGCTTRTTLHLVGPRSWTEVPATLVYDPADPFAVRVRFGGRPGEDGGVDGVEWLLGRDLVHAGLSRPAGDGDVRLWPARTAVDVLFLELRAPSGHALFELSRSVVADFLRATERLVPRGAESEAPGVDAELLALLHDGGADPTGR
ncbi:sporulation protein SsgA [Geodermatophilus sp. Leaf369]|uniref:SsgA family sporulation/cell division regulator n=1 Tax=Geodermatophilus sp. Leaf369 TaxID=1736354 RepID=UPI0006F52631|nr:SsgA family sporulation/cell division regulator [Geodermatophilus sp. Leaf369]KQS59627.1 sporulation protein SsgA [Geodermatophilus sp. Leaf369]QNG38381.1 SsgA family sporulation/cell division regulator [Geodermatophilaceae bacterium NBWT11]